MFVHKVHTYLYIFTSIVEDLTVRSQLVCFEFISQNFLGRNKSSGIKDTGEWVDTKSNLTSDSFIIFFDFGRSFVLKGKVKLNNFKVNARICLCEFMDSFQ